MRWLLPLCLLCACGVQGPVTTTGGGAGGGIFSSGGGSATGGGDGSVGGGAATLGGGDGTLGGGDGSVGGGAATVGGGDGTTGGGSAVTGGGAPDAGPAPLTWAIMSITGTTSSSNIIGVSGTHNDVWAVQDTGNLFHSTGGAFAKVVGFNSATGLYAIDGGVVVTSTRFIYRCSSDCEDAGAYATLNLLDSSMNWNYFAEGAICGEGADHVVVVASDVDNEAHLFEWNGSSWTVGANSLGLTYPRRCWFDENGGLYVTGPGGLVYLDQGASTPVSVGNASDILYGGATVDGTTWVTGSYQFVAKGSGTSFTQLATTGASSLFWAAGGLRGDEVFLLGYYTTTNAIGAGYVWNGTQLKKVGDTLPNMRSQSTVRAIHPTAENELFIGGTDGNGPVILRGRR